MSNKQDMSTRHHWLLALLQSDFAAEHPAALRTIEWMVFKYGSADGTDVYPSQVTVGTNLNLTQGTVSRHVAEAVKAGWLTKVETARSGISRYEVAIPTGIEAFTVEESLSSAEFFAEVAA